MAEKTAAIVSFDLGGLKGEEARYLLRGLAIRDQAHGVLSLKLGGECVDLVWQRNGPRGRREELTMPRSTFAALADAIVTLRASGAAL